jgi:outer membrane protein assembly factor BamB
MIHIRALALICAIAFTTQASAQADDSRVICEHEFNSPLELLAIQGDSIIAATPETKQLHAIDGTTCEVRWSIGTEGAPAGTDEHGSYWRYLYTVVTDDTSVYVASASFDVSTETGTVWVNAVDVATGAQRWRYSFADTVGKVSIRQGRLYVLGESSLIALDPADGHVNWSEPITTSGAFWMHELNIQFIGDLVIYHTLYNADPAEVGKPPYEVGPSDDVSAVVALNQVTGQRVWEAPFPWASYFWLTTTPDTSLVLFTGSQMYSSNGYEDQMVGLDSATGERVWQVEIEETLDFLADGSDVAVFDYNPDRDETDLDVFDAYSGDRQATLPVPDSAWPVSFQPGQVILEYYEGADLDLPATRRLSAVDAFSARELWMAPLRGVSEYGDLKLEFLDGVIYALNGSALTAVDRFTGQEFWYWELHEPVTRADLLISEPTVVINASPSSLAVLQIT